MKRFLPVLVGALVLAIAVPAHAKPTKVVDASGDANALNMQGYACVAVVCAGEVVGEDHQTPVQSAGHDIRTVTFSTMKKGGKPHALVVTLELGAAPAPQSLFRIAGDVGDCYMWLQYYTYADAPFATIRTCDPDPLLVDPLGVTATTAVPKVSGSKVTFTLKFTDLAKLPSPVRPGMAWTNLGAQSRGALSTKTTCEAIGAVPAPQRTCGAVVPQIDIVETTMSHTFGK